MSGGYLYIRKEELHREGRRKPVMGKMRDKRWSATWNHCPLTARELEILQHLAEGQTQDEIAKELGVTTGAIIEFVQQVRRKLGILPSRRGANPAVRLVAIAMREGWIE